MENQNNKSIPKGTGAGNSSRADEEEAVAGASDQLGSMTLAADDSASVSKDSDKCCASCGKTGNGLKRCTACKSVWYCGVNCQIDHRKSHKKECRRIKKELEAREKEEEGRESDSATKKERFSLFNPMPREECPICMVVMPLNSSMQTYMQCCGKVICSGCIYAHQMANLDIDDGAGDTCPFCRYPAPDSDDSHEEIIKCLMARVKIDDALAIVQLANHYCVGEFGLPVDRAKAIRLLEQAADLGCASANCSLAALYFQGDDGGLLKTDQQKAKLHWEFAAKKGDPDAHFRIGLIEWDNGNHDIGIRHVRISAQLGSKKSVDFLREMAKRGNLSKEELEESEKACNVAIEAMRTEERDQHILYLKDIGKYKGSIIDGYGCDYVYTQSWSIYGL